MRIIAVDDERIALSGIALILNQVAPEAAGMTYGGGVLPLRWVCFPAGGLACPCSR